MASNTTVVDLVKIKDYLWAEITACESRLCTLRGKMEIVQKFEELQADLPSWVVTDEEQKSVKDQICGAIYEVLLDERPLHKRDILDRVQSAGVYVGGKDPMNTLSPYLTNDPRFTSDGKGNWTLASEQSGVEESEENPDEDEPMADVVDIGTNS